MRVCIPTTDESGRDAPRSDHFGRAPYYTFVDLETDEIEVVENQSRHRGGSAMPPTFVAERGADAVLVDHVGKRGLALFDEHGVEVYQTESGTVADVVAQFESDDAETITAEDAHGHDHGHGHDHDHGHDH
ncbi:MAG: NifB/NifX family molybdenum-iron cluster-binding protein [Halanaeroarchaeum sp.]